MQVVRFSEQELVRRLERLPDALRTAFAAACAERMLPAYARFLHGGHPGDAARLEAILRDLWLDLEGNRTPAIEQQEDINTCMKVLSERDEQSEQYLDRSLAEDAVAALTYALRSRNSGDPQEAAWAARRAYESVDQFVVEKAQIDTNELGAEERVLSHLIVQAELLRQQRDLAELTANQTNIAAAAERVRERAKSEANIVFPSTAH